MDWLCQMDSQILHQKNCERHYQEKSYSANTSENLGSSRCGPSKQSYLVGPTVVVGPTLVGLNLR